MELVCCWSLLEFPRIFKPHHPLMFCVWWRGGHCWRGWLTAGEDPIDPEYKWWRFFFILWGEKHKILDYLCVITHKCDLIWTKQIQPSHHVGWVEVYLFGVKVNGNEVVGSTSPLPWKINGPWLFLPLQCFCAPICIQIQMSSLWEVLPTQSRSLGWPSFWGLCAVSH